MSKHTLEQVLEALINKEDDRATELLHRYFVSKGKSIYEELSQLDQQIEEEADEDLEEGIGGAADQDFHDEIIADEADLENETLFAEGDDEEGDDMAAMDTEEPTEPEATADLAMGDGDEEVGSEEAQVDDAMAKVDDALAELKALFAEISGGEAPAGDEEMPMGDADMPAGEGEEEFEAFGESATLKAVPKPTHGDNGQNTKSPVSTGPKISGNGAKAVNFTGESNKAGTQGGVLNPSTKEEDFGNVNKVGNAKAPALKGVAAPKNGDTAGNKTSPVAKN
jgi:hypothetical protein